MLTATKEQVKTHLATGGRPTSVFTGRFKVLIGEATVSVANGYNELLLVRLARPSHEKRAKVWPARLRYCYSKLAIDNCFFGCAEGGELFSCPPWTGSSRYPLISLQLLVLSIAIVTRPLWLYAHARMHVLIHRTLWMPTIFMYSNYSGHWPK